MRALEEKRTYTSDNPQKYHVAFRELTTSLEQSQLISILADEYRKDSHNNDPQIE
jgi:hypothetical protein